MSERHCEGSEEVLPPPRSLLSRMVPQLLSAYACTGEQEGLFLETMIAGTKRKLPTFRSLEE